MSWVWAIAALGALAYVIGLLQVACASSLPPEPSCVMTVAASIDAGR